MTASAEYDSSPASDGDGLDAALAAILQAHREATLAEARIAASKIRMYGALHFAAEQRTLEDCASSTSKSERQQVFTWHLRSIAGEYAGDQHLTDNAVMNRAHSAHDLLTKFPQWLPALDAGSIQLGHTRALLMHHTPLDESLYEEYGDKVLQHARAHTVRSTDTFAKRLAATLMRAEHERAHDREFAQRRVSIEHADFGMAYLTAYLSSAEAEGVDDLLSRQARVLRDDAREAAREHRGDAEFEADERNMAQIRADVFIDTLLSATPKAILESPTAGAARVTATISIVTPVLALRDPKFAAAFERAGGSDSACGVAMLNGVQPMSNAEARAWAADGELERILTHPITGHVITVDRYEPTISLRRYLRARDVTCRFPGCRRPARWRGRLGDPAGADHYDGSRATGPEV